MWKFVQPLVVLLLVHICISTAANDVVTENLKLFVDGKEFFIKAMCYAPAPLGQGVRNKNNELGGGYCSPKVAPFGMTTTTCYDSDYFDGSGDAEGRDQPTEGGWFQPIWRRDFPIMKSLGVNTLRLYSTNPTTKQASVYYPEAVLLPLGKDHIPFMDMSQEFGFKVVFPLIGDYGMLTQYSESTFKRLLRWQIDEVGNHPALLMWGFGNELPLFGDQALINLLNNYIAYIKQYTLTKWGRKIPVTTAVVDLPNSYDQFAADIDVDIFTTNAGYRGFTFTDLWSGNGVTQGFHKLSCRYNKPVFIGEIGWHTLNNAITYEHPNWFNQIWKDLVDHIDQGCIGGAFFEYSDEKLKADPLQQTMGLVRFEINNTGGQPSTEVGVWNADIAKPKELIFDAVKSGSYQGKFFNMNSSPFYLAGRAQAALGSSAPVCDSFNLKTCPAGNTCSFHGKCDRFTGTCACNKGWSGADCAQAVCTSSCSGRGSCDGSVSPPVCNCQTGWTGPTCSVQSSVSTCAANCVSGNGACDTTGKCVCYKGWYGHDCGIPDISYPPVDGTTTTAPPTAPPTTTTKAPSTTTTTTKAPTTQAPTTTTTTTTQAPTTTTTTTTKAPTTQAPTTTTTTTTTKAPTTTTTTQVPTTTTTTTKAPSTTTTTTKAPSTTTTTKAPSTTTTTKAPTTTTTTTKAPSTTTTTTKAPSTTTTTTKAPPVQPTTNPTTNPQCGSLKSCGEACYDENQYSCFDGFLCPKPYSKCGQGCYNSVFYSCVNDKLVSV